MRADLDACPDILMTGTPDAVDTYLVRRFREGGPDAPAPHMVVNWLRVLKTRGEPFASHVAACHYWLYEHRRGYDHATVFRPLRGETGWLSRPGAGASRNPRGGDS
ncbi:hypothetical protein [Burkholderia plantarii]|uniref:hypothetical protein n=1 Tax=Burkholderia plantarii TaxID=41899 RepID=UPI0018DEB450|nr:hypothetical protein [Burkholderia plantarii]MBI0325782.1 hypothetical protein [Burkholderia plantarii]